jgi:hypothetical protein
MINRMTGLGAGAALFAALEMPDGAETQDGKKMMAAYEEPTHIEEVIDPFRACAYLHLGPCSKDQARLGTAPECMLGHNILPKPLEHTIALIKSLNRSTPHASKWM